MLRLVLFLLLSFTCLGQILAQKTPFSHGALPRGWEKYDNTSENNGFLQISFSRAIDARMGFLYEGGRILVEQIQDNTSFEKRIAYNQKKAKDKATESDWVAYTQVVKQEQGKTSFSGFPAYLVYLHSQRYKTDSREFYEDNITKIYIIQIGKTIFEVFSESVSQSKGKAANYQREVDTFVKTFRFFGQAGEPGGNTKDPSTGRENQGSSDEDLNIGDVIVGVLVGGGAAGLIGMGIRRALQGGGASAGGSGAAGSAAGNSNGSGSSSPNSDSQNGAAARRRRKEEEAKPSEEEDKEEQTEEEEEEEDDEQGLRYALQVNRNSFQLAWQEQAQLQVAVWAIDKKGKKRIAQDATIKLQCSSSALQLSQTSAQGMLQCQIAYTEQTDESKQHIAVSAQVHGQNLRTRISIELEKTEGEYEIVTAWMPPDKKRLKPDAKDIWYLYAQLINRKKKEDPALEEANKKLRFERIGQAKDWIYDFEARLIDGWMAIGIQAQHPQRAATHRSVILDAPPSLALRISTTAAGKEISQVVDIPLEQPAVLDVSKDRVFFLAHTEKRGELQIDIDVFIENPADEQWTFSAQYEGKQALTALEIIPQSAGHAILRISGPTAQLEEGQTELHARLIVEAESKLRSADNSRELYITLGKEGIVLLDGQDEEGRFVVSGEPDDAAAEARFAVYYWDEELKELRADELAASKLRFDLKSPNATDTEISNMLSVANLQIERNPRSRQKSFFYWFQVENQIAGEELYLPFQVLVFAHSEETGQDYELLLDAALFAQGIGPNSEDWQREYENCRLYIERHVPEKYKEGMFDMLEKRKMLLGHEGLHHLRHKLHGVNQNLILAEGAQGYRDAEKWYSDMIEILEWIEWAGNLAFNVVAGKLFGPYAPAVTIAKSYSISAMQYVIEGKGLDKWLEDNFTLHSLFKAAEGRLIDVDRIAEYFKHDGTIKAYAKAWAIYIAYHFVYNVFWAELPIVDALKEVARAIRDEAIVMFFQRKVAAEAQKQNMQPVTNPLRRLRQSMIARANGKHEVSPEAVLACMRDPQTMRSIKEAGPDLRAAFNNTREAMYRQHDHNVVQRAANRLGYNAKDLVVDDFRTPGADDPSSINTDRDYRLLHRAGVDANGNELWFEVPKEKWMDLSYNEFGKLSNKPADVYEHDWAERHLQMVTDKYHIEASPDYSDQVIDRSTGKPKKVRPNILEVKEGRSRLIDSEGLGNMYHEKVHASLRVGQQSEAVAQCKKSVDSLVKVRKGYEMQNLDVGKLPPSIEQGMELVRQAPTSQRATPEIMAKLDADLRDLNFKGIEDFSNKLSGQYHALKKYDQGS